MLQNKCFPELKEENDDERMSVDEPSVPSDAEDAMDEISPKTPSELATSVRLCVCVSPRLTHTHTHTHIHKQLGFMWPIVRNCDDCGTLLQKEMDECENFLKSMVPKPPAISVVRPPLMDCKVDNNNNKKAPISAKSAMKSKSLVENNNNKKKVVVSPSSLKPAGVVSTPVGVVST